MSNNNIHLNKILSQKRLAGERPKANDLARNVSYDQFMAMKLGPAQISSNEIRTGGLFRGGSKSKLVAESMLHATQNENLFYTSSKIMTKKTDEKYLHSAPDFFRIMEKPSR